MFSKKTAYAVKAAALAVLLTFLSLSGISCSGNTENTKSNRKIIVAVTIVPEETFVKAVCGDLVEIVTLVPPGSSPENYEPTPIIMEKFEKADLYFSIGVQTEDAYILPNVSSGTKVITLRDEVAKVYPDRTFEDGERDPHIWLSPKRVKVIIESIVREMSVLDPENAGIFRQNADAYLLELDALDSYIRAALEGVSNRTFIVYHPAFGYLADDYGLTMFALEEEGKESTAKHLQEMIDLAKSQNIKAIFYQEEIDSSQSEAFAEELGGKTIKLSPLSGDYINNLKKMADLIAEVMK
jgi:zinc transport system substrate-binding protein